MQLPIIIQLGLESRWLCGRRGFLRLGSGGRQGDLARGCGGLADLLQRDPWLRWPPQRRPRAAELVAMHPFLQAAQDLEARGWAAQKEAAKAIDANDVLGAAVRPLQVQTAAGRVRGISAEIGDLK